MEYGNDGRGRCYTHTPEEQEFYNKLLDIKERHEFKTDPVNPMLRTPEHILVTDLIYWFEKIMLHSCPKRN